MLQTWNLNYKCIFRQKLTSDFSNMPLDLKYCLFCRRELNWLILTGSLRDVLLAKVKWKKRQDPFFLRMSLHSKLPDHITYKFKILDQQEFFFIDTGAIGHWLHNLTKEILALFFLILWFCYAAKFLLSAFLVFELWKVNFSNILVQKISLKHVTDL